jgi:uncharacterized protein YdbL (DUF1318 family)
MKRPAKRTAFILLMFFVMSACVTININFPAAAVEKAADKIVEEVWGEREGVQPEDIKEEKEGPQSFINKWLDLAVTILGPGEAIAQEVDINITTPTIRALKESIKERADSIKPYMDNGNVGLSNDGLLVIRSKEGLKLKEKAELTRLIKAENTDREALYAEIAKANNFPPESVSDIKEIFADSWIKKAKAGWLVQDSDGEWSKKE